MRRPIRWRLPVTVDQLESEVLKLPEQDRARLVRRLLASLDADNAREQAWYDEAERRMADLESGAAEEIPAGQVFEKLGIAESNPLAGFEVRPGLRRRLLPRFPFSLLYPATRLPRSDTAPPTDPPARPLRKSCPENSAAKPAERPVSATFNPKASAKSPAWAGRADT
jgi:putative addiction module component (TIGR02574 family)